MKSSLNDLVGFTIRASDGARGDTAERKRFINLWVDEIKLAPETLEVEIHYKIPEPVVDSMGADSGVIANYPPLRMPCVIVKKPKPLG